MALKTFEIPTSADGMKTEAFLRRMLPNLTESALRKLFDKKDVKLDDRRITKETPLKAESDADSKKGKPPSRSHSKAYLPSYSHS